MAAGWRKTARLVATAVAAAAVSRAAESLRRLVAEVDRPVLDGPVSEPLRFLQTSSPLGAMTTPPAPARGVAAQSGPPHEFGPAPVVTPSRGIGFRSEPAPTRAEMPVISLPAAESPDPDDIAVAEPMVAPDDVRTAASIVQDLSEDESAEPEPEPEPVTPDRAAKAEPAKHRRDHSAISGTVRSSRGRGLRGMRVSVLDEHGDVVASAITGAGGVFVAEDLTAGRYVVTVTDDDGDFAPAWHGGATQDEAEPLKVKDGRTRRNADVTLTANAEIGLDVDLRKNKAILDIEVTDRASGSPATGSVRVRTKLFSADLALTGGRATITVRGSADESGLLAHKKVRVDYLGNEHTQPARARVKLR